MKVFRNFTTDGVYNAAADAVPFYHDGTYHLYCLTPPVAGPLRYPERMRSNWRHIQSQNLVDWEELPVAMEPDQQYDKDAVWTGSAVYGEGRYHIFYTGHNKDVEYRQTICHATSDDGIHWDKDPKNPVLTAPDERYEPGDWRDPYCFYNEEDGNYWLLLSARLTALPLTRRGCIVLYRSKNLEDWEYYGPIYVPGDTICPECCEMYRMGDYWYLCYSRFSEPNGTIYRIASSPFGPWRTPQHDSIGNRRFYASKSMANDEGRRFYFGWIHDKIGYTDQGDWLWGGKYLIPHEVVQQENGELYVVMPKEIRDTFREDVPFRLKPGYGNNDVLSGRIRAEAKGTFAYGFFDVDPSERSFMLHCKLRPRDLRDMAGFLLKTNEDLTECLVLALEKSMQRVTLTKLPLPLDTFWADSAPFDVQPVAQDPEGPRVCEKVFRFDDGDWIDFKVVIDEDLVEAFIGDQVAFSYRIYNPRDYQIGWIVQDGAVEISDIELLK